RRIIIMEIDDIIKKVDRLKQFSLTYMKVKKMLADPYVASKKIVDVIKYDQSFTANILKICNSALYRREQKIRNLIQAVSLLGSNRLKQIVLIESVNAVMSQTYKGYEVNERELWNHSIITALIAEQIGNELKFHDVDTLFTAAILHDIGKVVLSEFVDEKFEDIHNLVKEGSSFLSAEKEVLGVNHAEVGGKILENWRFPQVLIDTVRFHHNPIECRDNKFVKIVNIADTVAMLMGSTTQRDGLSYLSYPEIGAHLKFRNKDVQKVISLVSSKINDVENLLS
ncbi:MAG: HDOD domain-containing protein, partial [Candidatus Cloacimonadota bacterium]|nr:HDOD domain-containing protein [Candidatus Cloacimonadota bacterium]